MKNRTHTSNIYLLRANKVSRLSTHNIAEITHYYGKISIAYSSPSTDTCIYVDFSYLYHMHILLSAPVAPFGAVKLLFIEFRLHVRMYLRCVPEREARR